MGLVKDHAEPRHHVKNTLTRERKWESLRDRELEKISRERKRERIRKDKRREKEKEKENVNSEYTKKTKQHVSIVLDLVSVLEWSSQTNE
jgi:hypothetical protein